MITYIGIQGYKLILMARIMRKKNVKIQMLAQNRLKIRVGAGFEISSTLVQC